jgi:hypothetical protein
MKGAFDDDAVKTEIRLHKRPMAAPKERAADFLVGNLTLHKSLPHFHYGWGGTLSRESAFRKQRFDYPDLNARGYALILRGFVHPSGTPEEFFAGWVPPEAENDLDEWIAFLNGQIVLRLAGKPYESAERATVRSEVPAADRVNTDTGPASAARSSPVNDQHSTSLRVAREQGLKPVGFFRELGNAEADAPSLVEARGRRAPVHKAEVVTYLRGGDTVLAWMSGGDEDFFSPGTFFGPEHISGDGVYAWPIALAAYVEFYDVELPLDFEEHMRLRAWRPVNNVTRRG